jgi:hypothetical protein
MKAIDRPCAPLGRLPAAGASWLCSWRTSATSHEARWMSDWCRTWTHCPNPQRPGDQGDRPCAPLGRLPAAGVSLLCSWRTSATSHEAGWMSERLVPHLDVLAARHQRLVSSCYSVAVNPAHPRCAAASQQATSGESCVAVEHDEVAAFEPRRELPRYESRRSASQCAGNAKEAKGLPLASATAKASARRSSATAQASVRRSSATTAKGSHLDDSLPDVWWRAS